MINRVRNSLFGLALCSALLSGTFPPPAQAQEEILFGTLAEVGKEVGKDLAGLFIEFLKKKLADKDVYFSPDDAYMFFEGNNCDATQQFVGSLWTTDQNVPPGSPYAVNAKSVPWVENDEARSVIIQKALAGEILRVYDSPSGSTADDWTEIRIKRDITAPHCIGSFEATRSDDFVEMVHHRHNGLDGKISRLETDRDLLLLTTTFWLPGYLGYRVDVCLRWGAHCDRPAADAWCLLQGYERATGWSRANDIGLESPTLVLGEMKVCNQNFCDGFTSITCAK